MDYVKALCVHLNVEPEQIMSHAVHKETIAVVVNRGIAGCPKYEIPLTELTDKPQWSEPVKAPPQVDAEPITAQRKPGRPRKGSAR